MSLGSNIDPLSNSDDRATIPENKSRRITLRPLIITALILGGIGLLSFGAFMLFQPIQSIWLPSSLPNQESELQTTLTPTAEVHPTHPGPTAQPGTLASTSTVTTSQTPAHNQMVEGQPTRLVIPGIDLSARVVPVGWHTVTEEGTTYIKWEVADNAVGWHNTSGVPGAGDNIVLSAHHNTKGELFRHLVDLKAGDTVNLYSGDKPYTYTVDINIRVPHKGMSEEVQRENAKWIGSFPEERLSLVTCWPYSGNTHRIIVVAKPQ